MVRLAALIMGILAIAAFWSLATPPAPRDGVNGGIFASGSSTVEPITLIVAEKLHEQDPTFAFQVEGPGTGDGFALFCNGETDINNASRPIEESEIDTCEENGIGFVELLVAYDGLSVITAAQNDTLDCLSFLDLYALLGPESQGIRHWSAADDLSADLASELGDTFGEAHAPYPPGDLVVTAPGEESGTYDTFVELVIGPIADERGTEHVTRPDYVASPNDNVILEGVAGTRSSLGWVGMAFAEESAGFVRQLSVDAGDGCVAPTDETVADGSYPIARPLFVYVNLDRAERSAALRAFVEFYLRDEGLGSAPEVGYVELTDAQAQEARAAWADARREGDR
ncbi:MAG TPA: substrate-binding domain-containing protein [Candidatus Limnocylindrales bacterium]|nr:substrate-binding domain-containing protein [Candidatus Limnocylindrales bacterium]